MECSKVQPIRAVRASRAAVKPFSNPVASGFVRGSRGCRLVLSSGCFILPSRGGRKIIRGAEAQRIFVIGAGVTGLWQAAHLARRGHRVCLIDEAKDPLISSASSYAGAMLAPYCEAEAAPEMVLELGKVGLELWRDFYPGLVAAGTLVLTPARDRSELDRFARVTEGHSLLDASGISELEPDIGERFPAGLYFADEAHLATPAAQHFLLDQVKRCGGEVRFGSDLDGIRGEISAADGWVIDCRGLGARRDLPRLRGVRGERVLLKTQELSLKRPIRLLHPRHPIYVVPWGDGVFMVGATVIESEDDGPVSVRSMLELLGAAYTLHPAFGEAEVVDMGAGVRPSFDDNVPRVIVPDQGKTIRVNGAYRHGFLLAPVLAMCVAELVEGGSGIHPLVQTGQNTK